MSLAEYFEHTEGTGILATADAAGRVDLAIYAKPHVIDDTTVAFVMRQRLSHHNLASTLHAAYMFIETGQGYKGVRLYLTKQREEVNASLVARLRAKQPEIYAQADDSQKYLVIFRVDHTRPLVGEPAASAQERQGV